MNRSRSRVNIDAAGWNLGSRPARRRDRGRNLVHRRAALLHCELAGWCRFVLAVFVLINADVASANDDLRGYEKRSTRQETLEATLAAAGKVVVGEWEQIGPMDPILRRPQPPEEHPEQKSYPLWGGGQSGWKPAPFYVDGHICPICPDEATSKRLAKRPTVCLRRVLRAPAETTLRVFLGCDSGTSIWLNGRPVFYSDTMRYCRPGEEVAELPLREGENLLVLKVSLTSPTCRFFFLPDFGQPWTEQLLAALDRDFPCQEPRGEGYRERAAQESEQAESRYWRLVEMEPPPGVVIEGGGLDFLPDGRLAVSTRRGFVYVVRSPASDRPEEIQFEPFAAGLYDALGLLVVGDDVLVANRGELTRLVDCDGDGRADRYECVSNDWGLTGNYHEYTYGPVADRQGRLYLALNLSFPAGGPQAEARYRGCVIRIGKDGRAEVVATGLRSPNGIGRDAEGNIFVTDNQGDWVAACPLYHVADGRFFGHPLSARWHPGKRDAASGDELPPRTLPAVWFPYEELCQSATEPLCDETGGAFGPFGGQLFVGEMTKGLVMRVQLEKVDGEFQGACFPFRRGCGAVNRLTFGPAGKLYFARCNRGWGGGGRGDGLARLEFTGRVPLEIERIQIEADGFTIRWTLPLAAGSGGRPDDYQLEQYGYEYWGRYGSPKIDVTPLRVRSIRIAEDRRSVRVVVDGREAGKVCQFRLGHLLAENGERLLHREAFYTMNRIPGESR